jgi:hypothetical protein
MCLFCAAIPTVATVGLTAVVQQRTAEKTAVKRGEPLPRRRLPAGPLTVAAVVLLGIGSTVVHLHAPL